MLFRQSIISDSLIIKQIIFLFFLLFALSCPGQAPQISNDNSNPADDQLSSLYSFYFNSVSTPNELINGKEYLPYFFHGKTTPLLFSGEPVNAILMIRGRVYKDLKLQYDTYLDEVIYTDTSRMIDNVYPRIALNKDIVEEFYFMRGGESIDFRNIKFPESSGNKMESGFYEIAYEGPTQFIIRHRSTQYNYNALNEYKYSPARYVLSGSRYNLIKNNKSFLQLFGDSSGLIRHYLKSSGIKVRRADKQEIIGVLRYFDSLSQAQGAKQ